MNWHPNGMPVLLEVALPTYTAVLSSHTGVFEVRRVIGESLLASPFYMDWFDACKYDCFTRSFLIQVHKTKSALNTPLGWSLPILTVISVSL